MVLLLTDGEVQRAFEDTSAIADAVDAVERSFVAAHQLEASGASLLLIHPSSSSFFDAPEFVLSATWGIWPSIDAAGGRMMGLRRDDLGKSTVSSDTRQYWRPVWSTATGELIALMPDAFAAQLLVGAHVGVATRHLSRPESSVLGVIGSGGLAGPCLEAICATRPIEAVKVYSPTARHRERFASKWNSLLSAEVVSVGSVRDACAGADIITLATSAHARGDRAAPVLSTDWVMPGCHVNTITAFETDRSLHMRAKIIPSSTAYLRDHAIPIEPTTSMLRMNEIPHDNLPGDLIEVVGRGLHVRQTSNDVTLYVGPSLGFQHAAICRLVVDRARDRGLGLEWDPIRGTISKVASRS